MCDSTKASEVLESMCYNKMKKSCCLVVSFYFKKGEKSFVPLSLFLVPHFLGDAHSFLWHSLSFLSSCFIQSLLTVTLPDNNIDYTCVCLLQNQLK